MKKTAQMSLFLLVAFSLTLASCKKDEETIADVTASITPSPTGSIAAGTTLKLTLNANGNDKNKITEVTLTRSGATTVLLTEKPAATSYTKLFEEKLDVAGSYTYTFTAKGDKNNAVTSYTVLVTAAAAPIDVTTSAVSLYGQTNNPGASNNFLQLTSPFTGYSTTTFDANKTNIDLVFFYGSTNKATLASPSDVTMQTVYTGLTWTGAKVTGLAMTAMTAANFDAAVTANNDAAITAQAQSATWSSSINMLTAGKVLVFKTASGKYGLILVEGLSGTAASDAKADLKVMVQK